MDRREHSCSSVYVLIHICSFANGSFGLEVIFKEQWFLASMGSLNLYRTISILLLEWCEVGRYGSEAVAKAIGLLKAVPQGEPDLRLSTW